MKSRRLVFNISGELYETLSGTLQKFPTTLLGDPKKRAAYYCSFSNQYLLHRSRLFFDAIIFFYQSDGLLRCPIGLPLDLFEEECRFFQIPESFIRKLRPLETVEEEDEKGNEKQEEKVLVKSAVKGPITIKSRLWNLLRNPEWSASSWWFSVFSLIMILLSVISSCLETIPTLHVHAISYNKDPWIMCELVLNVWFLLELFLCTISTPDKREFFRLTMTWIDIIAVVPYFAVLTVSRVGFASKSRPSVIGKSYEKQKNYL